MKIKQIILAIFPLLLFLPSFALAAHTATGEITSTARVNQLIEEALQQQTNFHEQAVGLAEDAVALANQLPDQQLQGRAYYTLGFIHYRLCNMDSAVVYLQKSLSKMEQAADSTGIGISLNRLGNVYWYLNEQATAKSYYEQARDIHARLGNDKELGKACNNLAGIYRQWGEYKEALHYYLEAGEHFRKADYTEGTAWLDFSVTLLYKKLQNYDKALESINCSLQLYQKIAETTHDSSGLMLCYGQLGDIYMHKNNTEKALEFHFKALRMRQSTGRAIAIADGLMGVGQVYYKQKNYLKAIDYINRSMECRKNANLGIGTTANLRYLGFIHNDLGDSDLAITYLEQALAASREQNERYSETQVLKKLYQIYSDKGKFKTALDYCEQYIAVRDSTESQETSNRIASIEIQAQIQERDRENAALIDKNRIAELELAKSQGLKKLMGLAIGFAIFVILAIIHRSRLKSRDNRILTAKNIEITTARQLLEKEIVQRKAIEQEREKLITELQDSLSKIKTMSGLIPICANCKKIRNDNGFYEQVEKYVMDHSDAVFSHGICPECMETLYGEHLHDDDDDTVPGE